MNKLRVSVHRKNNRWLLSINGKPRVQYGCYRDAIDAARDVLGDDALPAIYAAPEWHEWLARVVFAGLVVLIVMWVLN